jgi:hypothetical protein
MEFGGLAVIYLEQKILSDLALFLCFMAVNDRVLLLANFYFKGRYTYPHSSRHRNDTSDWSRRLLNGFFYIS